MRGRRSFCGAVAGLAASFFVTSAVQAQDDHPPNLRLLFIDLSNLGASDGHRFLYQFLERPGVTQFMLARVTSEDWDLVTIPDDAPRIIIGVASSAVSVLGGSSIQGDALPFLPDIGMAQALYHLREWVKPHGDVELLREIDTVFHRNITPQAPLSPSVTSAFLEFEI